LKEWEINKTLLHSRYHSTERPETLATAKSTNKFENQQLTVIASQETGAVMLWAEHGRTPFGRNNAK